jgi:hypothetical protein
MPDSDVDGNAAASAGDGAGEKYADAERDIYLSKHSAAKRAVLCVIVLTRQARGYGVGDVQAIGREIAADKTEGGSVLSK